MGIRVSVCALVFAAGGLFAGTPQHPLSPAEMQRATDSLRQISAEINDAQRQLKAHLSELIARHDRGYRIDDRTQVAGADADLGAGPADLMWSATQRFVEFRVMASRENGAPPVAADLDRVGQLILEARKRVDTGTGLLLRLTVVSAGDLDRNKIATVRLQRDDLQRARAAAEDAAKQALMMLPFDQSETDAADETAQRAWDGLRKRPQIGALRPERRKRVTIANEISYRLAVTDSGIEDKQGRHLFYQEEWVQRGPAVIRLRWRVAVEPGSGEHVLLVRYAPREMRGRLADLYSRRDRDYLWYLEPPTDAAQPTPGEMEAALARVTQAREAIRAAAAEYRSRVRKAVLQQDQQHEAAGEPAVDSDLPEDMRQKLFTIRAQIARVASMLQMEDVLRRSFVAADDAIGMLEPIAAWCNLTTKATTSERTSFLDRADWEVDSVRDAENAALSLLPPDTSKAEENYPAMERNLIVRIRRSVSHNGQNTSVRCLQEIWRMESGMLGSREVRRSVSLIAIDPKTGNQKRIGGATKYYKAAREDALEEVFDEYASQEVRLGS